MFDNVGGKIKVLAKVICWIGIICSCIVGFMMLCEAAEWEEASLFLSGLLIAGLGSLASWISSFALCGFGQLIENTDKLVAQGEARGRVKVEARIGNYQKPNETNAGAEQATADSADAHKWRCEGCGRMIDTEYCTFCGTKSGN